MSKVNDFDDNYSDFPSDLMDFDDDFPIFRFLFRSASLRGFERTGASAGSRREKRESETQLSGDF